MDKVRWRRTAKEGFCALVRDVCEAFPSVDVWRNVAFFGLDDRSQVRAEVDAVGAFLLQRGRVCVPRYYVLAEEIVAAQYERTFVMDPYRTMKAAMEQTLSGAISNGSFPFFTTVRQLEQLYAFPKFDLGCLHFLQMRGALLLKEEIDTLDSDATVYLNLMALMKFGMTLLPSRMHRRSARFISSLSSGPSSVAASSDPIVPPPPLPSCVVLAHCSLQCPAPSLATNT
jgi:hypothetical protein